MATNEELLQTALAKLANNPNGLPEQRLALEVLAHTLGFVGEVDYDDLDRAAHMAASRPVCVRLPRVMTALGVLCK